MTTLTRADHCWKQRLGTQIGTRSERYQQQPDTYFTAKSKSNQGWMCPSDEMNLVELADKDRDATLSGADIGL